MKRIFLDSLLLAAAVFSFAACNQDTLGEPEVCGNKLSFSPHIVAIDAGTETKATQINTSGQVQDLTNYINEVSSFNVIGYNSDATRFIPSTGEETVTYNNSNWNLTSTPPTWLNNDQKTFYAYAKMPAGATVSCTSANHTFTYPSLPKDASNQLDALLGYYKGIGDTNNDGNSDGVANVQFVHPLTAVVFEMDTLSIAYQTVTQIDSIAISGVYSSGTATVTYQYDSTQTVIPSYSWTRSGSMRVVQTVGGPLASSGSRVGQAFIIFPQDLSANPVDVDIYYSATTKAATSNVLHTTLDSGKWREGFTNIYRIGYNGDILYIETPVTVNPGTDAGEYPLYW